LQSVLATVEAEVSLSRTFVDAVALEAVLSEDWPDFTGEIDLGTKLRTQEESEKNGRGDGE
jgi:hypothetical protein